MAEIRFDERVAIVTGAGGGIGRTHALLLAERGAKVVVNDLGGNVDGSGEGTAPADGVVAEITDAGGIAMPDYRPVDDFEAAEQLVQDVYDRWGRVDIVINNAGILRDRAFNNMTEDEFDRVYAVHL
ncbi:MAG: SDR family NAD(P)-dependent oxidoreductase, partial [Dehalococcoidia bacterium]